MTSETRQFANVTDVLNLNSAERKMETTAVVLLLRFNSK